MHGLLKPTTDHHRPLVGFATAAAFLLAAGCSALDIETSTADTTQPTEAPAAASEEAPEIRLSVVVSDPPLVDLVARVAGDDVAVTSVVPMGADGHTYEPQPEDARTLSEADIYIENGLDLNEVVSDFARTTYPSGTPHYELSAVIPRDEIIATDSAEEIAAHGHAHNFNAHFWPDAVYAQLYVAEIASIMSLNDPDHAADYQARADQLTAELAALDTAFATAIATIPEANRKMVVYHDSWSYFGRRYGLPVIGAIQPTDFSEPSASELRDTIEQVRAAQVPAFFGSEVFPSDVLAVVQEETGATYVADLSDDVLPGSAGDPEHSYAGMMVSNVRTIVTALGGDASALDAVDPARG